MRPRRLRIGTPSGRPEAVAASSQAGLTVAVTGPTGEIGLPFIGALERSRAVLASGVILSGSTPVYDLVRGEIYRRTADRPLEIPAGAVVVPGTRASESEHAKKWGVSLYAAVIVKYRDDKTDAATTLEEALR